MHSSDEEDARESLQLSTQKAYQESLDEESVKPAKSRKRAIKEEEYESSENESPVKHRRKRTKTTGGKFKTTGGERETSGTRPSRRAAQKGSNKYKEAEDSNDDESDYEETKGLNKKKTTKARKNARKQKKKHYESDDTDSTAEESQDDLDLPKNFGGDSKKTSALGSYVQEGGDWRTTCAIDY